MVYRPNSLREVSRAAYGVDVAAWLKSTNLRPCCAWQSGSLLIINYAEHPGPPDLRRGHEMQLSRKKSQYELMATALLANRSRYSKRVTGIEAYLPTEMPSLPASASRVGILLGQNSVWQTYECGRVRESITFLGTYQL